MLLLKLIRYFKDFPLWRVSLKLMWLGKGVGRKRKVLESTYVQQEVVKKVAKLEEEGSVRTEFFEVQEKVKPDAVIPLLQSLIGNILEHKDPSKIVSGDISIIENCLEQVITKKIHIDILLEHRIGRLLKDFYDFVRSSANLEILSAITRCAFKRLKKRTWKELFGERKTLQCIAKEDNELINIPLQQVNKVLNEEIKEEIEDATKANAEIDISLDELKQAVVRKRMVRESRQTYNLRQVAMKSKRHINSRKRRAKALIKKVKEVNKSRIVRKKKADTVVEELTKLLEEV
jgi:hypothetical protein